MRHPSRSRPLLQTLVLGSLALSTLGCSALGDPVAKYINSRWPPIQIAEQRQEAVAGAARALSALTAPNIAFGAQVSDLEKALDSMPLKEMGITKVRLRGEERLLRIEADFKQRFSEAGPGSSPAAQELLRRLSPEVSGKATIYAGLTSEMVGNSPEKSELQLKILPAISSLKIDRVVVAEKQDVTALGEALATAVTRYAANLSGELARSPLMSLTVPTSVPGQLDASGPIRIENQNATVSLDVQANPVQAPARLLGVGWLIGSKQLMVLAQIVPIDVANLPAQQAVRPEYDAIEDHVEKVIEASFTMPSTPAGPWFSIRRDLIASIVNSVTRQASLCVSGSAELAEQKVSEQVRFPDESTVDCTPTRNCSPTRACDFPPQRDETSCRKCILWRPGWPLGDGGCAQHGNDLFCETAKAANNLRYQAEAAGKKLDCERLKATEKGICEAEKTGEKALCETGKEALKRLARTGKFANIDATARAKADGMRVCLQSLTLSPNLDQADIVMDINGEASADVSMKFVPLDIVGHLTCQVPWTESETFRASLRKSEHSLSSGLKFVNHTNGAAQLKISIPEKSFPLRLQPSPTEFLMTSVNMTLACQGLNLVKPLVIQLTPFIPELRGEIDYKAKEQEMTIDLALPSQKVGNLEIRGTIQESPKALFLIGELGEAAPEEMSSRINRTAGPK